MKSPRTSIAFAADQHFVSICQREFQMKMEKSLLMYAIIVFRKSSESKAISGYTPRHHH